MNALSATDVWAAQTKSNLYSSNGSSWTALSSGNNVTYKGSYPTSSVILMIGQQVNAGNKELVLVTYNHKYQKWYSPIVGYSTTDGTSTSPNFRFNSIAGQNDGQQIHIVGSLVDNLSLTTKGLILYR